jgi:hypothetical protein
MLARKLLCLQMSFEASGDADTKLALGEEVGGKIRGGVFEDGRGKEAAPGEANAEVARLEGSLQRGR